MNEYFPDLSTLSELTDIEIANTKMKGGVPSYLGTLRKLRRISIHDNDLLGGTIPIELALLGETLTDLFLYNNGMIVKLNNRTYWNHPARIGSIDKIGDVRSKCQQIDRSDSSLL
jgi:hypothetical protein